MSRFSTTDVTGRARAPERPRGRTYWRDLDWVLLIGTVCVTLFGAVLVWSASRADMALESDPQSYLKRHLINVGIAVALAYIASRINYRWLRAYAPILYAVSVFLLLLPFVPGIGTRIAGARSWIDLPIGFTLQPSEFVKITIILMMAVILSEKRDAETEPSGRQVLIAVGVAVLPILIVLVQNDTGTVLIMGSIALTMIAISGAGNRWVFGLIGGAVLSVLIAIQLGLLKQYQVARLTSFLDPTADAGSASFNSEQARIAIGGGGLTGYGLFEGPQTQGKFVPVNESDFVFTVAGEELGFIGAALLILMLTVLLWRGLRIAMLANDLYGRLLASGVVAWLAFQIFENIGMSLGIMPITGIPLPFVSAGGTSMMATWIAVGLLENVRLHAARSQP